MRINHNKLVRNHIPSIIEQSHKTCKTRVLNDEEYLKSLQLKLLEESKEVYDAHKDNITEEIANVLEVIDALLKSLNISYDEVNNIREIKIKKNGRFNHKIFLEYVEDYHG